MTEKVVSKDKLYYTFDTLSKELEISKDTLYRWRKSGLKIYQIKNTKVISVKNLEEFLKKHEK